MQRFSDKSVNENRTRTYVLPFKMRQAGFTIASINNVSALVSPNSTVVDPTPAGVIDGAPQIKVDPWTWGAQSVGANQAIAVMITGGLVDCEYVLTFDMQLSTGERFVENVVQVVKEFVP